MIHLLTGDNLYEIQQAEKRLRDTFDGEVEQFDGIELTSEKLADITSGATLFSSSRFIVIKDSSSNKVLWDDSVRWFEKVGDETTLVLVEPNVDKRTKTYKWLQTNADVQAFSAWGDRDTGQATNWVIEECKKLGKSISRSDAARLVDRVGVDQWQLYHAIEKLSVLESIDAAAIEQFIDSRSSDNVFMLFETALKGDTRELHRLLSSLQLNEDPYRVFGLLVGQALQLGALAMSAKSPRDVAADIGAHPFALQKLAPYARSLSQQKKNTIIDTFAEADYRLKTSDNDPWVIIEQTLLKMN